MPVIRKKVYVIDKHYNNEKSKEQIIIDMLVKIIESDNKLKDINKNV